MSKNKKIKPQISILILGLFFLLCFIVGVSFYHLVEKMSFVDAIYLTSVTLTTVGYGDVAPQTDIGKIFTSVFSFVGVGTFLGFASVIFSSTVNRANHWPFGPRE